MPPRARRNSFRGRGFRPAGVWSGLASTGVITVAAATKVILGSFVVGQPLTLRRTRGVIFAGSDQIVAAETVQGAVGLVVVSEDAFAAGAASIPGPVSDIESELWAMYQPFFNRFSFATAVGFDGASGQSVDVDSRGQRKVTNDERIVFMVENASVAAGLQIAFNIRIFATETSRG